ncbi:IucA/IucC family siderophore biosynthesis protein, partial [Cronobacter sakazakii]|nr:IucA/IucC family siderophore biosynthesis protein [Cronobacter sakazakii]
MTALLWERVNREMVAKMLAELEYERTLTAQETDAERWTIALGDETWTFDAKRGIWGWLHINPATLANESGSAIEAESALRQLAVVLKMSDAQTAEHLEDLYATLRGDMQLLQAREGLNADALVDMDPDELQCLMSGHPKFIFNKGRRGWGLDALKAYAPEYRGRFRLHWVAVRRDLMIWSSDADCDINNLLASAMDDSERQRFTRYWQALTLDDHWLPVPLHPWQWQQKIALHFLPQLARGEIIDLGVFGDEYIAQQSLRTLTNVSRRSA